MMVQKLLKPYLNANLLILHAHYMLVPCSKTMRNAEYQMLFINVVIKCGK